MQLVPLQDHIVARRAEPDSYFNGLLYIPDVAQKESQFGTVIEVGPGRILEDGSIRPLTVQVGNRILWHKDAGVDVTLGREKLTMLSETQVLCIEEEIVG